jgi:hypothetical protein
VRYRLEALSATPAPQVMVLDEIDVGQDLNANGSTTDDDVRIVSTMDRSHSEHVAGVRGAFAIGGRGELRLEVDRRWRSFSSEQPLDLANFGRRDSRNTEASTTMPSHATCALRTRGLQPAVAARATPGREIDDLPGADSLASL